MEKNAFIFNCNKCVGCMACVAGCTIENGTDTPLNWRMVNEHNKIKHPGLPVFHFSLACNHCEDAPCMTNCPALAYTRDIKTGAIIHHAEACIACTYCTWACPYDAPKFNEKTKIIEKCDFCVDRISEGKKPACVQACPVGALDFGPQVELDFKKHLTPGFVNAGIRPSIQLIPLREEHTRPKIENIDAVEIDAERFESYIAKPKSKVSLEKEWTLVLFTLAAAGLVAWQASGVTSQIAVSPIAFIALAILSITLTSLHIGKKVRLWRIILNLKGSWLSREIVSFSAFFGLGAASLLMKENVFGLGDLLSFADSNIPGYAAMLFGAFTLISADLVYSILLRKENIKLHSAMVWTTGLLLFAWFANITLLIGFMTLLKGSLYFYRKQAFRKQNLSYFPLLSAVRLLCIFVPYVLLELASMPLMILLALVFLGEIIDRSEFYNESNPRTPQGELTELFHKLN